MDGFIILHRKIADWEWYTDINAKSLFIHLLLMANHSDQRWRGQIVKRGEFVTSIATLSVQTGLSAQQVRSALKKLQKTGDIIVKSTNKNTLIMVVKYDFYQTNQQAEQQTNNMQDNKQSNKQMSNQETNEQQSSNNQITTNNNDNNDNNDNKRVGTKANRFLKPSLEDVANYCSERGNDIDPQRFIDYYESNGWMVGRSKMKDWKAAVRNWESRSKPHKANKLPDWYEYEQTGVQNESEMSFAEIDRMQKELMNRASAEHI